MPRAARHLYEFGPFCLDPAEQLLLRDGKAVALTPKAFETLFALVENCRHVLKKEELMSRVWPDTYVEEANLAQNISTLRKALGVRPDGGQYIETVPKRGYRFVVSVNVVLKQPTRISASLLKDEDPKAVDFDESYATAKIRPRKVHPTGRGKPATTGSRVETITAGMQLGHYEIIAPLGAGGMGVVYLARDTQLDRNVALKLLSRQFTQDERSLRRFIREAKAVSALNHPNILTVYEIRDVDGIHYIATEYIEGDTLRQRINRGALEPLAALEIAIQVAGGLAAAHATGIVHRDIKPENIMVRPDGYAKILDFGIAKLAEPRSLGSERVSAIATGVQTDSGLIMGTLDYMSPEQARGLKVDARSDLFSLGVVLYEMIAGRAPFAGASKSDVLVNLLEHRPPTLSNRLPGALVLLERLIEQTLHKDRDARIQTAENLQHELKHLKHEIEFSAHSASEVTRVASASTGSAAVQQAPMRTPEIRYARSGEVNIAYQVLGDAPLDLVFVMGWVSHLEYFWTEPHFSRFLLRLASFSRLILFDKRGTGLSDRVPLSGLPTLEQRMDDVRAVMDAVGSTHAVLCGVSEGGPLCSLFAATYPEKVTALIMIGTYAKRIWAADYPWAPNTKQREHFFDEIKNGWGGPVGIEERAPSMARDPYFREWWATYLRMGASPGAALALTQMNAEIDVRNVLPTIRVPTLILHRTGDLCLKVEEGRYVARRIPGAKMVELPGADHLPFVGDQDAILEEIEEFLTGMRHAAPRDTVLATVLATFIPEADRQSATLGPERWRLLLEHHREHVRCELELFEGREVEHTNTTVLATFDGPARAIRAACAINASAQRLGLDLQTGLHTGECKVTEGRLGGLAFDIAQQVARQAEIGEVLASSTVKDLVAGSGIGFSDRGAHALPGVPDEWRLFSVLRTT